MTEVTPDQVLQIVYGFLAAKQLFVANEVGVFEKLADSPATLDDLAQRTGVPQRTLRILADAMVALGFVVREGEQYRNSPVANTFLSGRTPADLRPVLRFWNRLNYGRWTRFEEAVRTDQAVFGEYAFTPEEQRIFSEGVEAIYAAPARALAMTYDFARHRQVLDLGGGTGSFLLPVLRRYDKVEGTLFDLPAVTALARRRLPSDLLATRLHVVEGDFFTDAIPDGHDPILIANVCHSWLPERNRTLLRRVHAVTPDRARLLLVDLWTDPTHTQPLPAALMAGQFLLTNGQGDVYSEKEVRDWLQATGWRMLERKPLEGPTSLIVAEKAE